MDEILRNLHESIHGGLSDDSLEILNWMDSRSVAEAIRNEHPRLIAIVMARLEPDMAADVMARLPTTLHADVMLRTAKLGGEQAAANIIAALEPAIESDVIEHVTQADSALGARIQELVFVFDNLIEVDDRSLQEILRLVRGDQLLLALKGCDESLKQKIFRNMSQRAAEMLCEDLEAKGPVRLAYVESAQKAVLAVARSLAAEGVIGLGAKGEAFV